MWQWLTSTSVWEQGPAVGVEMEEEAEDGEAEEVEEASEGARPADEWSHKRATKDEAPGHRQRRAKLYAACEG